MTDLLELVNISMCGWAYVLDLDAEVWKIYASDSGRMLYLTEVKPYASGLHYSTRSGWRSYQGVGRNSSQRWGRSLSECLDEKPKLHRALPVDSYVLDAGRLVFRDIL